MGNELTVICCTSVFTIEEVGPFNVELNIFVLT